MRISRHSALFCGAAVSVLALTNSGWAQSQPAGETALETVTVTGSLIRGAKAVGVPVVALGAQSIAETGALNLTDVLRETPAIELVGSAAEQASGGNTSHGNPVDIHGLQNTTSNPTLVLIDGLRIAPQNQDQSYYDPSFIPTLAVSRVDVLTDGASATYGSDAVAGVVNVNLKRGYEGAVTELRADHTNGESAPGWKIAQLIGKTWDTGDVTFTYEYYHTPELQADQRPALYTYNFTRFGLPDVTPIASSIPATVSTGKPNSTTGTSCTNCFSTPHGTNGVGLPWAQFLANPGVTNEINPYNLNTTLIPEETRNGAVITFDQEVLPGVKFFGEGFYSSRRGKSTFGDASQAAPNYFTDPLPTNNAYYPVGAPAGLNVSFTLAGVMPGLQYTVTQDLRTAGGFNVDLPFDWKGKFTAAYTNDLDQANDENVVNANNVLAALGNTVSVPASDGYNSAYTFTKPANVPYLNPFCDTQSVANCISPSTLAYVTGYRRDYSNWITNEYSSTFDGPLYDLPGGPLSAAIGASFVQDRLNYSRTLNTTSASTAIIVPQPSPGRRNVWAGYAEFNIPIISDQNALPLVKQLTMEASIRHDQYSSGIGGTTNPKVAIEWQPIDDLKLQGSWNTSFIAPSFAALGNNNGVASKGIFRQQNLAAGATSNASPTCPTVGGQPVAGSIGALLNPTCTAALEFPGGVLVGPSVGVAQSVGLVPAGQGLKPQKSQNLSVGGEFAPVEFLDGLDVNVTYWFLKMSSLIGTGCADLTNPACTPYIATAKNNPNYAAILAATLANPSNPVPPTTPPSNIAFILNGGDTNLGSLTVSGFDFGASYDRDFGNWGDWKAGFSGTAYLNRTTWDGLGNLPNNFQNPLSGNSAIAGIGNPTAHRVKVRGRLGWQEGSWTATGFVNYADHYYVTDVFPAAYLATHPSADRMPSYYTFDLSAGYNLHDTFESVYLKDIAIQLVMNNVLDRDPLFEFNTGAGATRDGVTASNNSESPLGRTVSLTITKKF